METIFDYSPTAAELKFIGVCRTKDKYIELFSADTKYIDLAWLMFIRKQESKMREYLDKVKNIMLVQSFWRTIKHP